MSPTPPTAKWWRAARHIFTSHVLMFSLGQISIPSPPSTAKSLTLVPNFYFSLTKKVKVWGREIISLEFKVLI